MDKKSLGEIEEKYDLELDRIVSEIRKAKAKLVLLQFPDGLKPYATVILDFLEGKINLESKINRRVEFLIWFGSCYGACDIPTGLEKLKPKIDLIVQFGHNELQPSY